MNDQKIELTLALVNSILSYLGTKPYGEVFQLVNAIQEQAIPQMPQMPAATVAQPETTQ